MDWPQHAVPAVNAVVNDEKVIVLWKLMLVYAVHSAFGRCAAESVTCLDQTGELRSVSHARCSMHEICTRKRTLSVPLPSWHY